MDFFDKLSSGKGGYIFVSHSHADFGEVRRIRNELEEDGFEPLCFYLKCLDDESEIEDLIKREIDAREWFIFVDSENARRSKWVALEREYITRTDSKKILTVELGQRDAVAGLIQRLKHHLRVFISYCAADSLLALRIKEKLEEKDYLVFFAEDALRPGDSWEDTVASAIAEAAADGCVIVLLTRESAKSAGMRAEILSAFENSGNIITFMAGDVELDEMFDYYLRMAPCYRISEDPTDGEIEAAIEDISNRFIQR